MVVKKTILFSIIYWLFAFDSALKIDFGFQIHLGVFLLIVLGGVVLLSSPQKACCFVGRDKFYFIVTIYIIISGFIFFESGYKSILIYVLLSLFIYFTCYSMERKFTHQAFYYFQIFMIVTGLFQYSLYKITGYQISFIDAEHYSKGSSVSHRLRGFFVEPNWFAISFIFNSLLLIGRDIVTFTKNNKYLALFSALVLILNGSLTTMGIFMIIYTVPVIIRNPIKAIFGVVFLTFLLSLVFYFRMIINQKQPSEMLNHTSRLIPFERVVEHLRASEPINLVFGYGLGSWGTKAIENRLSVLVFEEKPSARDGSEAPVMLFEFGIFGVVLLIIDLIIVYCRASNDDIHLKGGVILFFVCLLFYPTLKFWIYMPYYFIIRTRIVKG
ncbi:hypothetical protein CWO27_11540 [Vibrio sp. 10N.286.51.C3]|uniref:hypothetical protein n=1 Tax=unclassified Vibrio TaxID=2614977 RepID=UPI000D3B4095|nr:MULTISPECIES: hypothetical protein [unclassified Vibrio]PTP14236.1 hypothetical protein CWO27_11540 [Vibrio sp. 10N.286.51.C3]TKE67239.1 hypothetical protein FCV45_11145 [Vibrio sp. F12]